MLTQHFQNYSANKRKMLLLKPGREGQIIYIHIEDRQTHRQTDRQTDRRTDGRTDGWVNPSID